MATSIVIVLSAVALVNYRGASRGELLGRGAHTIAVDLRRVQEKWRRRVLGDDEMAQADACAARLGEPPLVELP